MAYLFPPMNDEPPPDYLAFVAERLPGVHREAMRLAGGDVQAGGSLTMDVLTDVAGHWRRLDWQRRLHNPRAKDDYLRRRLETRTKLWREEQIHPVDVLVQRPPGNNSHPARSVAQRLASLICAPVRPERTTLADAAIAWVHACRRATWHRYIRVTAGSFLLLFSMMHFMSQASS
ncbi:hypothetical protein [Actinoplanes sp. TFC3]|uniref:hypothetical protein n=1 Tax=Actinoplanes sp. TFC3 TaxID=1710355 RepID=UPI00128FD229|nr:hypothetical protein [Actinoplanes sp. TFC3]